MIYTETKGKEGDVMQSSESASGSTNTINDNASSIRQGVPNSDRQSLSGPEEGGRCLDGCSSL